MTLTAVVLAGLVVACGACLQGVVGFGLGIFGAPILALIDPRLVPGPLILVAGLLTVVVVAREHRHVDLAGLRWALVGRVPGTLLGALGVAVLPQGPMLLGFALLVLAGVAITALGRPLDRTPGTLVTVGGISGLMATAASVGGPPIALAYQDAPGPVVRATLSAFFLVGTVLSVGALAAVGRFGRAELTVTAVMVPFMLAGLAFSPLVNRRLDQARTRSAILLVAAASALVLLVRQLGQL